jgi:hypothetical protein
MFNFCKNMINVYLLMVCVFVLSGCGFFDFSRSLNAIELDEYINSEKDNKFINVQDFEGKFTILLFERNFSGWGDVGLTREVGCSVITVSSNGSYTGGLTTLAHKSDEMKAYQPITILSGVILEHNVICILINDQVLKDNVERAEIICNKNDGKVERKEFSIGGEQNGIIFVDAVLKCSRLIIYDGNQQEMTSMLIPPRSGR